jgi:hypothetical protein
MFSHMANLLGLRYRPFMSKPDTLFETCVSRPSDKALGRVLARDSIVSSWQAAVQAYEDHSLMGLVNLEASDEKLSFRARVCIRMQSIVVDIERVTRTLLNELRFLV